MKSGSLSANFCEFFRIFRSQRGQSDAGQNDAGSPLLLQEQRRPDARCTTDQRHLPVFHSALRLKGIATIEARDPRYFYFILPKLTMEDIGC